MYKKDSVMSLSDIANLYNRKHSNESNLSSTLDNTKDLKDILNMEDILVNKYKGYRTVTLGVTMPKAFCLDSSLFSKFTMSLNRELSNNKILGYIWSVSTVSRDLPDYPKIDKWDVYFTFIYANKSKVLPGDSEDLHALLDTFSRLAMVYKTHIFAEPYIVTHPNITVESHDDYEMRNMARYQLYDVVCPRYTTEEDRVLLDKLSTRIGICGASSFGMVAEVASHYGEK